MTAKNSSRSSASRMKRWSGSDTSGLKQMSSRPLISPSWIASTSGTAESPLCGIDSSGTPQTPAMYLAVLRVLDVARAGELVALAALLARALAVALAGDRGVAAALAADAAGRQRPG